MLHPSTSVLQLPQERLHGLLVHASQHNKQLLLSQKVHNSHTHHAAPDIWQH